MIKRILMVVAVVLVLLLALVGGIEIWYGRWFSQHPLDLAGIKHGSVGVVDSRMFFADGEQFVLRYDSWGFRGTPGEPSRITILSLGGQSVSQSLLPEDKTWQRVMQAQFQADPRDDVIVANAGRNGYGAQAVAAALHQWLSHVPGLHPRFVLVMVGDQGVDPVLSQTANDPVIAEFNQSYQDLLSGVAAFSGIMEKSGVFRVLASVFPPKLGGPVQAGWPLLPVVKAGEWRDVILPPADTPSLADYRQTLKQIADDIHNNGAVPVFVTVARGNYRYFGGKDQEMPLSRPVADVSTAALAAYNASTRAVCREHGFLCLDLAREVKFEPNDFYDYVHYSPQGADKIGRWLHSKLAGLV